MREKVGLMDSGLQLLMKMSEGNPGAATVLAQLFQTDLGIMSVLSLDDMNIRGSQIWIGYKDYCKQDIDKFKQAIQARDPEMVAVINKESGSEEQAVTHGASFKRQ